MSPEVPPLESLMESFLGGDVRAFEQLYRRLHPRVVGMLRGLCRDARLAEDLAQTAFLKVHRARDTYQRGAPVEPWVFTIARRTWLDDRRSRARRPEDLSVDGSTPEAHAPPPVPQGFERLDDTQTEVLQRTLADLPAPQREALVLLKLEGLSVAQAAAVCGTTPGALKVRAHRAYERLRAALGVARVPVTDGVEP